MTRFFYGFSFSALVQHTVCIWNKMEERLSTSSFSGSALILLGITLAVVYGNPSDGTGVFERIQGSLFVGIFWASIGALGQAGGALAAKPILDDGADLHDFF